MEYDLILVGGGLANSLIAWRLQQSARTGGNHTWSFHGADLTTAQHGWLAPLVAHVWHGYEVRFPRLRRTLTGDYLALTSERLQQHIAGLGRLEVRCHTRVGELTAHGVRLEDGEFIEAGAVIDGRGHRDNRHWLRGLVQRLCMGRLEQREGRPSPEGATMTHLLCATPLR